MWSKCTQSKEYPPTSSSWAPPNTQVQSSLKPTNLTDKPTGKSDGPSAQPTHPLWPTSTIYPLAHQSATIQPVMTFMTFWEVIQAVTTKENPWVWITQHGRIPYWQPGIWLALWYSPDMRPGPTWTRDNLPLNSVNLMNKSTTYPKCFLSSCWFLLWSWTCSDRYRSTGHCISSATSFYLPVSFPSLYESTWTSAKPTSRTRSQMTSKSPAPYPVTAQYPSNSVASSTYWATRLALLLTTTWCSRNCPSTKFYIRLIKWTTSRRESSKRVRSSMDHWGMCMIWRCKCFVIEGWKRRWKGGRSVCWGIWQRPWCCVTM